MPDFLIPSATTEGPLDAPTLLLRLLWSLGLGLAVAWIYRKSHGREQGDTAALSTTLVLLSVLIAMVTLTIGNSVARAFSLVGALSIVRFRTVVNDTRDTAFVIFAVIVGMSVGAGLPLVPLIGLPIAGGAAILLSRKSDAPAAQGDHPDRCSLQLRMGLGRDPGQTVDPVLQKYLSRVSLQAAGTARQGAALDLTYSGQLNSEASLPTLVAELNQVEGVMEVEIRRA